MEDSIDEHLHNHRNTTNNGLMFKTFTDPVSITVVILKTICIFLIIFGNGLVVLTVFTKRQLRRIPNNIFIASLAVTDCLVGTLVMLPSTFILNIIDECKWTTINSIAGHVARTARIWIMTSTMWHLSLISYDRYQYILRGYNYKSWMSGYRMYGILAVIWLFSGIVAVKRVFMENLSFFDEKGMVFIVYAVFSLLIGYIIPCVSILYFYKKLLSITKKIQTRRKSSGLFFQKRTVVISLIVGTFYVLWLPLIVTFVLVKCGIAVPCSVTEALSWLSYCNSLTNCFVYTMFNPIFRNALLRVISCNTHGEQLAMVSENCLQYPCKYMILNLLHSKKNVIPEAVSPTSNRSSKQVTCIGTSTRLSRILDNKPKSFNSGRTSILPGKINTGNSIGSQKFTIKFAKVDDGEEKKEGKRRKKVSIIDHLALDSRTSVSY